MLQVEAFGLRPSKGAKGGFVYVLRAGDGAIYKIGHTVSLKNRLKSYRRKYRFFEVQYLITIPTNDCEQLEAYLQKQYADYRLTGEWYLLPGAALDKLRKVERQAKEDL